MISEQPFSANSPARYFGANLPYGFILRRFSFHMHTHRQKDGRLRENRWEQGFSDI